MSVSQRAEENSEEDSSGEEEETVSIPKLRPALPGERFFWALFLAVVGSSIVWAPALAVHFGYLDPNVVVDSEIVVNPDISGPIQMLVWAVSATIVGVFIYAFARVAGVAPLTGVVNFFDTLIHGYESPRLTVESDEEE